VGNEEIALILSDDGRTPQALRRRREGWATRPHPDLSRLEANGQASRRFATQRSPPKAAIINTFGLLDRRVLVATVVNPCKLYQSGSLSMLQQVADIV